jgi:hypothetical protein
MSRPLAEQLLLSSYADHLSTISSITDQPPETLSPEVLSSHTLQMTISVEFITLISKILLRIDLDYVETLDFINRSDDPHLALEFLEIVTPSSAPSAPSSPKASDV